MGIIELKKVPQLRFLLNEMKRVSKLVIYGLILVGIAIAIIFSNVYPFPSWATANQEQEATTIPKRLKITVNISEPDDLKVSEGEEIVGGEIIADRERERCLRLCSANRD